MKISYKRYPRFSVPVTTCESIEEGLKMTEVTRVDVTKETVYTIINQYDLCQDYKNNKTNITDLQVAIGKATEIATEYGSDQYVVQVVRVVKVKKPAVDVIVVDPTNKSE